MSTTAAEDAWNILHLSMFRKTTQKLHMSWNVQRIKRLRQKRHWNVSSRKYLLEWENFRCMRMRNGIRCTFMWFISFHRPYVRMHCSACENISGVLRFLSLAVFLIRTCWVMMRTFMLWQSNPIIMFRVISSPFPQSQQTNNDCVSEERENHFPGFITQLLTESPWFSGKCAASSKLIIVERKNERFLLALEPLIAFYASSLHMHCVKG